jgi:NADH-quinone oxidoreductase subunit M
VEAPTPGSMLLASLLLKLGGYGFLRYSLTFLMAGSESFRPVVAALALAGVIYGALSTLRQVDLKRIIAYSSVSHMNLVVLALFSLDSSGLAGAIFLMVAHGIVSAALFFCVGIVYDRTHSRLLRYYGGLTTVMPLFATFFFLFNLMNMSFPGTPNFVGELLCLLGIVHSSVFVGILATPGIVLAAAFSIALFGRVCFGTLKFKYTDEFYDLTRREFAILILLTLVSFVLGLNAGSVLNFVN